MTAEAVTTSEALSLAQLDWRVRLTPVFAHFGDVMVKVPDSQAVVRDHPKAGVKALGVVGMKYVPVQNEEAFSLITELVGMGELRFDTAGSLFGGRQIFVTARLPESIHIAGHDEVRMYLLATNRHDGKQALRFAVTPIRVVCQNTLVLGLKSAPRTFSVRHTGEPVDRVVTNARDALELVRGFSKAFGDESDRLAAMPMTTGEFSRFVQELLSRLNLGEKTERRYAEQLMRLWDAPTQKEIARTHWAAYNAFVEWVDWYRPVRQKGKADPDGEGEAANQSDLRAARIITGAQEQLKAGAFDLAAAA